SKNCGQRIRNVSYSAKKSRFVLRDDEFEIPMIGEFNLRNAAMAISAAKFYGVSAETIRAALPKFEGVARRQEIRGEVRGVKEIQQSGRSAFYEPNANAIIERIVPMLKKNDIVTVFSNGGFDRIHEKLLARLRSSL